MTSLIDLRPKEAGRLLRLQRRLARGWEVLNRRSRLRTQAARVRAREADRRKDWVETTTTDLAHRFDVMGVEDLKVKAMTTRPARGTIAKPGRDVHQKAGLGRGILAAGWSPLLTRLGQKAPGRVEKVNPAYASATCNTCRHSPPESGKNQADLHCVACGHRDNVDVVAACNIGERRTAAGQTMAARGDGARSARSVKCEPQLAAS